MNYAKTFFPNYAKHSHDRLCISALLKGEITVEFHNQPKQYIQPDKLIVFNPHQVHISQSTPVKSYDYFTFHFAPQWLKQFSDKNIYFDNLIEDKNIFDEFVSIAKSAIYYNNKDIESRLGKLIDKIIQTYAVVVSDMQDETVLYDIQKYILQNLTNQLTLDDISVQLGYTKEHIIRIFKKEFGLTPHAFLMNAKVNKAKNILENNSKQNLSHLAVELGFCDQSHLNKFFKKTFGITPHNYKL